MDIGLFLHLYQPPTQFPEITERIVRECYDPILTLLELNPKARITINFPLSLVEQLDLEHESLLWRLKRLVSSGQVELTGSAAYHPLLTRIPVEEVERQISLNEHELKRKFGVALPKENYAPGNLPANGGWGPHPPRLAGFFPPEMAINSNLCREIDSRGYTYCLLDESALPKEIGPGLAAERIWRHVQSGLILAVRHKELSLAIAYSRLRSVPELLERIRQESLDYAILAMDGETFGHHRPEQMELLKSLFEYGLLSRDYELRPVGELLEYHPPRSSIEIRESSWGEGFERWNNPENPLHPLQWRLLGLGIEAVHECAERDGAFWNSRTLLDRALCSDQFWWAAHNPCWHYQMVERSAKRLLEVIRSAGSRSEVEEAQELYDKITKKGLELYGPEPVAC